MASDTNKGVMSQTAPTFNFIHTSCFRLIFPHPPYMASTGYISISAMFYLFPLCSIIFQFLLLLSDTFTRTVLEHSSSF